MSKKGLVLKDCDSKRAAELAEEIGKVRCWLSGFAAARRVPGQIHLNDSVPGVDALRQIQVILKDAIAKSH